MIEAIFIILAVIVFGVLCWWIEVGSARMHMRQAIREANYLGHVPPYPVPRRPRFSDSGYQPISGDGPVKPPPRKP